MLRGFGIEVAEDGSLTPEARALVGKNAHIVLIDLPEPAAAAA